MNMIIKPKAQKVRRGLYLSVEADAKIAALADRLGVSYNHVASQVVERAVDLVEVEAELGLSDK